jgi:competence protein ComGC
MLGNKMFLMMGVSGLMLMFMPKMMKQMQEMSK